MARNERLATAGLWVLDEDARASDPVVPAGEHGIGFIKRNWLERQLGPRAFELHAAVKRAFDPENLLNPGKKA